MNYIAKLGAVSAAALMAGAISASAASLTINSITGSWSNPLPTSVSGLTIDNGDPLSKISWGAPYEAENPEMLQSGYDFTSTTTPFTATEETSFVLGDFVHHNYSILMAGGSLESVLLDVVIDIAELGRSITSQFVFHHEETPNQVPCASESVSVCDDVVTIGLSLGGTDSFIIDDVEYVFNIDGFRLLDEDGNLGEDILTRFLTLEDQSNEAFLVGSFVTKASVAPIPLPAAGWLMIAGLGGLAALRRKKKAA